MIFGVKFKRSTVEGSGKGQPGTKNEINGPGSVRAAVAVSDETELVPPSARSAVYDEMESPAPAGPPPVPCFPSGEATCPPSPRLYQRRANNRPFILQRSSLIFFLLIFVPALSAGDPFEALVREAYVQSPALQAAHARWQAEEARIAQATALPDPLVSYGYFVRRMETRQQFRVEQMFPAWGQRRLRGEVAESGLQAAAESVESVAADLRLEVLRAAADYALVIESIAVVEEDLEALEALIEVAGRRYEAGEGSQTDLLRLESERDRLRNERVSWEARKTPSRARISSLIGGSVDTLLDEIERIPETGPVPEISPHWMAWVREHNPELRRAAVEVQQAELERALARTSSRPEIMLGIEYMENRRSAPDEVMAMVGVSLPIWQGRYRAERRESLARLRERQMEERALHNQIEGTLHRLHFAWADAERRERLYREQLIPRANQTLELMEADYRVGRVGFLDWMEIRRSLLSLKLESIRARNEVFVSSLQWERVAGEGGRMRDEG